MSKAEDIIFKIITIGDSGVGKTSILKRYVYNSYNINSLATVGVNFSFKDVVLKNGTKVQLKLIDTAGQEKYKSLAKTYYKNTEGVLFVFSFDDKKSFDNLTNWIDEFKENNGNENIPTLLIGNKSDVPKKEVDQESINKLLSQHKMKYIESSALNNENIDQIFDDLSERMYIYSKSISKNKQQGKTLAKFEQKKKISCLLCRAD